MKFEIFLKLVSIKSRGIYVTIHQRSKILPFRNFTFYFSNSVDFVENKRPFIHCNSDVEALPKIPSYSLTSLLVG